MSALAAVGTGASHQPGWIGLGARLLELKVLLGPGVFLKSSIAGESAEAVLGKVRSSLPNSVLAACQTPCFYGASFPGLLRLTDLALRTHVRK